ncbi:hypothetical protein [Epilithonimonas hominis]|uniref:hypothetical protein n=1 Tax=Epilithonimonas hominis TaxID=420404 RepID=UPI00289D05F4|nr:hypothetical protein [Epilithonimonas hominis]
MKILLLQEMSGVHTELKKGLVNLGVDVAIATLGDGFKKYQSDIFLGNNANNATASFDRVFTQLRLIDRLKKYDIIQTISPDPFHKLISRLMDKLVLEKSKTVYVAAGSDPVYRYHVQELKYYPPHDEFKNEEKYRSFKDKLSHFDKIIPVCWEYEYSMTKAGFMTEEIIPFPIEIRPLRLSKATRKIRVFHPLNRTNLNFDFKGTLIIQEAFKILTKRYGDVAEFICKGNMTHVEYDNFTDSADLIVDQLYSYSYGMSAAYGLAKGKVVFSGLEDVIKKGHYANCPIVNVLPTVEDVVEKVGYFIENNTERNILSERSRKFAEYYHDTNIVAKRYLDIYLQL